LAINYGRAFFDRVVIFRPHNVYGADMGWEHVIPQFALRMRELSRNSAFGQLSFPIQGSGRETRAFIHIDDFTDGLALVLAGGEHLGIYHIGTEEEVEMAALAKEVGTCFGREIQVEPGPLQPGSTMRRCPNISKMRRLGFAPKISLHSGLPGVVRWYDQHADQAPRPKRAGTRFASQAICMSR
jgi:nucleoside-diphosphate-sugar epimerase